MELKILGSSSAGNCYIFDNEKEALIVECGISFKEVKKAVDFDISRIVGCLISHEHGDHSRFAKDVLDTQIKIYASQGTKECLHPDIIVVENCEVFNVGSFKVQAFDVQHDAAEPFGFLIYHPEMGTTLFATDTYYLAYTFNGLNNILIEANYRLDNIKAGNIHPAQRDRVLQSHMSYDTCVGTLLANDLTKVNNIVLIHLSAGNSNEIEFMQGIQEATGKTVHIAQKGMILKFNKTPF